MMVMMIRNFDVTAVLNSRARAPSHRNLSTTLRIEILETSSIWFESRGWISSLYILDVKSSYLDIICSVHPYLPMLQLLE